MTREECEIETGRAILELRKEIEALKARKKNLVGRVARLEAGRPVWHKVADGDLPPLGTDVFICIKLLNNTKTVKIGSFQQGGGLLIEGFIVSADAAVAWQPLTNLPAKE